jgi:DNA-binding FadR family transcriptional regulator
LLPLPHRQPEQGKLVAVHVAIIDVVQARAAHHAARLLKEHIGKSAKANYLLVSQAAIQA